MTRRIRYFDGRRRFVKSGTALLGLWLVYCATLLLAGYGVGAEAERQRQVWIFVDPMHLTWRGHTVETYHYGWSSFAVCQLEAIRLRDEFKEPRATRCRLADPDEFQAIELSREKSQ